MPDETTMNDDPVPVPQGRKITESRLLAMINASGDCFWEMDAERRYVFASENMCRLVRYPQHELIGRSVLSFVTPEYRDELIRLAKERGDAAAKPAPIRHEGEFLCKDGTRLWGETVSVPVFDDAGKHLGYFGITRDITPRKHDEQALREQLLQNEKLHAQLRELATRDELTGLYNRRQFIEVAERELLRAQSLGQPLSLLMLDVDHFKRINDLHGHMVGDEALRVIGSLLGETTRTEDLACRLGGEEFAVLLPGMDHAGARARAETLRQALAGLNARIEPDAELTLTASFGVGTFPEHADSVIDLMRCADRRLYEAKAQGRNRVVGATAPGA